jgi:hypothetical protein
MLYIPNIIWTKFKPLNYEKYVGNENKILVIFERFGEVMVSILVVLFSDFNINFHSISGWLIFLLLSFLVMILYEIYWIRYFKSPRTMKDFYSSILGIPVAGASLPIISFILLGIYGKNIFLLVATVILGIGHIGIHYSHKREVDRDIAAGTVTETDTDPSQPSTTENDASTNK